MFTGYHKLSGADPAPGVEPAEIYPGAESSGNVFSTSAYNEILNDDKIGERVDANTTVIRRSGFKRIEPLLRFGNPCDHDKR